MNALMNSMYAKLPNLVIGFHGCNVKTYEKLKRRCEVFEIPLPQNRKGKSETDLLLRDLDCAVIQQIHQYNLEMKKDSYDSVRGVFTEGGEIYPGAGIAEKTHIQLCIINPNCIKGYFSPLAYNEEYSMP